MKKNNYLRKADFLGLLCLACISFLVPAQLSAQAVTIDQDYETITIPNNSNSKLLYISLRGGDGGNTAVDGKHKATGGGGATVKAIFKIGESSTMIRPGSKLKFFRGLQGASENAADHGTDSGTAHGGGGRGSAVLYQKDQSSNWVILAVAGGGGGAYSHANFLGTIPAKHSGKGGNSKPKGDDHYFNQHYYDKGSDDYKHCFDDCGSRGNKDHSASGGGSYVADFAVAKSISKGKDGGGKQRDGAAKYLFYKECDVSLEVMAIHQPDLAANRPFPTVEVRANGTGTLLYKNYTNGMTMLPVGVPLTTEEIPIRFPGQQKLLIYSEKEPMDFCNATAEMQIFPTGGFYLKEIVITSSKGLADGTVDLNVISAGGDMKYTLYKVNNNIETRIKQDTSSHFSGLEPGDYSVKIALEPEGSSHTFAQQNARFTIYKSAAADDCSPDNTPPIARCKDLTVQAEHYIISNINEIDAGSSDNCGIQSRSLNFTSFTQGTKLVTLTVTDTNGNQSTCTAEVTLTE